MRTSTCAIASASAGQSAIYFPDLVFYHRYDRGSAKAPLGKAWQMHASSICKYFWKHRYVVAPQI